MIGRRVRARDASFAVEAPFPLELGGALEQVRVAYRTWGRLAPDGTVDSSDSPTAPAAPPQINPPANGGADGDHPEWV